MYGNERQVGGVLADFFAQGKLARESVFWNAKIGAMPGRESLTRNCNVRGVLEGISDDESCPHAHSRLPECKDAVHAP